MSGTAGTLLALIRTLGETTRAELVTTSGLARSTVASQVGQLIADRFVTETGTARSTGGRPASILRLNRDAGVVLVADLGATHARLAVCDLAGTPLTTVPCDLDIALGPAEVLGRVDKTWREMLAELGKTAADVRGIGVGVPGPVEFSAGRAVHPPIMPGWDGHAIADDLRDRFGVPALVDNDVNIMALGERSATDDTPDDMVFVKVGTGIGSGLILGGRLHRGARTAGDIGHIDVGPPDVVCRCGNHGCLEASAGGAALARDLAADGLDVAQSRDVAMAARAGDHRARRAVREAGRLIGEALAAIVNLLNPSLIVVGGDIAEAGEQLVAGIREVVYQRSTALATMNLEIRSSTLGDHAGIAGAAVMILDEILAPEAVDAALAVSA